MIRSLLLYGCTLLCLPWLLFAARSRSKHQGASRHILVMQFGKIGDLVCTTPLLRALHDGTPESSVTVLCVSRAAPVLQENPCVHDMIFIDDPLYINWIGRMHLAFSLYRRHFDVSIAVLPGCLNAVLGLWTSAPVRMHTKGSNAGIAESIFHWFHTHRSIYRRHTRTYDHYMRIADMIGVPSVPYRHEVYLSGAEKDAASAWLQKHGVADEPFVILSVTAGNVLKEWPLERFIAIADTIIDRRGYRILFSSADTVKTALAAASVRKIEFAVDAGALTLRPLCAVIARARAFISVDTGPLYIAHALNIPLVNIIGPVDPLEQPPPESDRVRNILPPDGIQPSSFVAETLRHPTALQQEAIQRTSVEMVLKGAESLLEADAVRKGSYVP